MPKRKVGSYSFEITHPDKVLFPESGITKGELVDYYERVSGVMLPHVKNRPMILNRYPSGIGRGGFIQQNASDYYPDWIKRADIERREGGMLDRVLCQNRASIVYLANQGTITFHIWLSLYKKPELPDRLIIDLDPQDDDFETVRFVARAAHELLTELSVPSHIMTTGSRGLHIAVPLKPKHDFNEVRDFARDLANILAARHPERLTTEVRKNKRRGRLFLDVARNSYGQTGVAPYSVRANPGAPVATPLSWDELGDRRLDSRAYNIRNIAARLNSVDDPWKNIGLKKCSLDKTRPLLDSLKRELAHAATRR